MEGESNFIEACCWREAEICIVFIELIVIHLADALRRRRGRVRFRAGPGDNRHVFARGTDDGIELPHGRVGGMREDSFAKQDCNAKFILKMNLSKKKQKNPRQRGS
jgi:hypothetical protein